MNTKTTRPQPRPLTGDESAKRSAVMVLEVLAGLRTPSEASTALGVTTMRYYVLERRALEGMVQALQPRPKGKRRRPEDAPFPLRSWLKRLQDRKSTRLNSSHSTNSYTVFSFK